MLGFIAITAAVTNMVSGFLITDRMLKMFKKREESGKMRRIWQFLYMSGRGLIHSVAQVDEFARYRAPRRVCRARSGMLLAVVGTLMRHEIFNCEWILVGVVHRRGDRRSACLLHADDGGSAADRAFRTRAARWPPRWSVRPNIYRDTLHETAGFMMARWSSKRCWAF